MSSPSCAVKSFSALAGKLLIALCIATAMSATAQADDRRRDSKHHAKHHHEHRAPWSGRHHHARPPERRDYRDGRRHHRPGPDWRYHDGRYWAPAHYRGRRCDDRRHYHGVHFHVAARDYYAYYYPRFRVHGPIEPSASLIITLPLF